MYNTHQKAYLEQKKLVKIGIFPVLILFYPKSKICNVDVWLDFIRINQISKSQKQKKRNGRKIFSRPPLKTFLAPPFKSEQLRAWFEVTSDMLVHKKLLITRYSFCESLMKICFTKQLCGNIYWVKSRTFPSRGFDILAENKQTEK